MVQAGSLLHHPSLSVLSLELGVSCIRDMEFIPQVFCWVIQPVIMLEKKKKGLFLTNFTFLDRSNFLGTKFTVYDAQPPHAGATVARSRSTRLVGLKQVSPRVPAGNYPVIQIAYELNVLGSR